MNLREKVKRERGKKLESTHQTRSSSHEIKMTS